MMENTPGTGVAQTGLEAPAPPEAWVAGLLSYVRSGTSSASVNPGFVICNVGSTSPTLQAYYKVKIRRCSKSPVGHAWL